MGTKISVLTPAWFMLWLTMPDVTIRSFRTPIRTETERELYVPIASFIRNPATVKSVPAQCLFEVDTSADAAWFCRMRKSLGMYDRLWPQWRVANARPLTPGWLHSASNHAEIIISQASTWDAIRRSRSVHHLRPDGCKDAFLNPIALFS